MALNIKADTTIKLISNAITKYLSFGLININAKIPPIKLNIKANRGTKIKNNSGKFTKKKWKKRGVPKLNNDKIFTKTVSIKYFFDTIFIY